MAAFNTQLVAVIPQLRRYARSLVLHNDRADDLVQDCLLRAMAKKHLCDNSKPIRPWLFTIMHNIYVNSVRKFKQLPDTVGLDQTEEIAQQPTLEEGTALYDLKTAFNNLSSEHREVLSLIGLEEMSYKETSTILNIPVGTVMSRLARARKNLHLLMNGTTSTYIRRVK